MFKWISNCSTYISIVVLIMMTSDVYAGPSDFKKEFRYNSARQLTGELMPDPDSSGPLKYPAIRKTYNSQGLLTKVETGEINNWPADTVEPDNWTGFTVFNSVHMTYDAWGRELSKTTKNRNNVVQTISQKSYDNLGQLQCDMVRMTTTLASDPCMPQSHGGIYDRVTKFEYNSWGYNNPTKIIRANGTPLQQNYAIYTYVKPGLRESVTDANGNYSKYVYDGHDRLEYWYFPSKTTQGVHSNSDYEKYGYDDNRNQTSLRKRDGQTISYQFDALNRMTLKNVPGTNTDVYYKYDLRGLQLHARFGSHSGQGVINAYTGFGEVETSTTTMGGTTRILNYQYDKHGNRIKLTHPDLKYFDYAFDGLDRLTSVKANGTTVYSQTYQPEGFLDIVNRGTGGASTSYEFDDIGRLDSFNHNLSGTANDLENVFQYNRASQVLNRTISNSAYDYTDTDVGYENYGTVNGLNQYTNVDGDSFSYDARGNLTSDGSSSYAYNIDNLLVSISGSKSGTLSYDPLGRLYQYTSGSTNVRFLYDGDALVAEYSSSGTMLKRYIHSVGTDVPIIEYIGGSSISSYVRRYLHTDHQGSIVAVSDNYSSLRSKNTYDAYGIPGSSNSGRFQYTGQIYLQEIELYHYKARMYNPRLGRFMQTDPIGYDDNNNWYAYVGNDPVSMVDPTGEIAQFFIGAFVGAVIDAGVQYALTGEIDGAQVVSAAIVGALTGGVGGLSTRAVMTGRMTSKQAMVLTASTGGLSNGGATMYENPEASGSELITSIALGTVGAGAGSKIATNYASNLEKMARAGGISGHMADTTKSVGGYIGATGTSAGAQAGGIAADIMTSVLSQVSSSKSCSDYDRQSNNKGC